MSKEVAALTPEKLELAEAEMLRMPQAACPVRHYFAPGLYIRELRMAKGTVAMGHAQRAPQMNVLLAGAVRVLNDQAQPVELRAPLTFVGPAGRKLGVVLEDVIWLNVYPNPDDCQDVATLEQRHLDKSRTWLEHHHAAAPVLEDQGAFARMLEEIGVSAQAMEEQSQAHYEPFPPGCYPVKVGPSRIHGQGLIATADIAAGQWICPCLNGLDERTPAARYTNHSDSPNAEPAVRWVDRRVWLRALRDIPGCRGGQDGEEITIDYRASAALKLEHA